tara:strand:+ start:1083 stop:1310 length:228 start_codon:yes stop_codon:yes gene_type:complete
METKKVVVKTLVCEDGVVGLNGQQYLLNNEGTDVLDFESRESAIEFLIDNGCDQDYIDEWIEFEPLDEYLAEINA